MNEIKLSTEYIDAVKGIKWAIYQRQQIVRYQQTIYKLMNFFCEEHSEIPLFLQAWWMEVVCVDGQKLYFTHLNFSMKNHYFYAFKFNSYHEIV
ncbi:MAG: hypothetical protein LBT29_06750 [Flavobacteriaceae bacterium]|jgi:hypothetical protein|nr:hypothetical protein [Flavobacteriaceae bacterium]